MNEELQTTFIVLQTIWDMALIVGISVILSLILGLIITKNKKL